MRNIATNLSQEEIIFIVHNAKSSKKKKISKQARGEIQEEKETFKYINRSYA